MQFLADIDMGLKQTDPYIRITKNRVILSSALIKLLQFQEGERVRFRQNIDTTSTEGSQRIYISTSDYVGYVVKRRYQLGRINSSTLSQKLSQLLQGYGAYRVCGEIVKKDNQGKKCYEIFFRKYE